MDQRFKCMFLKWSYFQNEKLIDFTFLIYYKSNNYILKKENNFLSQIFIATRKQKLK